MLHRKTLTCWYFLNNCSLCWFIQGSTRLTNMHTWRLIIAGPKHFDHMLKSCIFCGWVWSHICNHKQSAASVITLVWICSESLPEHCREKNSLSSLFVSFHFRSVSIDRLDFSWTMSAHSLILIFAHWSWSTWLAGLSRLACYSLYTTTGALPKLSR